MEKYTLDTPIEVIDQTITMIRFREPTGQDLIGLPNFNEDQLGFGIALANRLANNVPADTVLTKLRALDAMKAGLVAASMLNPTPPASSSIDTSSAPAGGIAPEFLQ